MRKFSSLVGVLFCVSLSRAGEIETDSFVTGTVSGQGFSSLSAQAGLSVAEFSYEKSALLLGDSLLIQVAITATGEVTLPLSDTSYVDSLEFDTDIFDMGGGTVAVLGEPVMASITSSSDIFVIGPEEIFSQVSNLMEMDGMIFRPELSYVTFEDWWEGNIHLFSSTTVFRSEVLGDFAVVPEPSMLALLGCSLVLRRRFL